MCYTYDNLSRVTARTVKKLSDNSVVSTETFNYDAAGNVTSAPDSSFQYDTNNRLISFNGNTVSYDLDGTVCGLNYNGTAYYFYKNLQGDVIAITDNTGAVVARYTYDAWGKCTIVSDDSDVGIATINPFRYRSYYYDTETGFYYLQSRYYNPKVGKLIKIESKANLDDCIAVVLFLLQKGVKRNMNTGGESAKLLMKMMLNGSELSMTFSHTRTLL